MAGYSSGDWFGSLRPGAYPDLASKLQAAEDNFFLHGNRPSGFLGGLRDAGPDPRVSDYSYNFDSMAYSVRADFGVDRSLVNPLTFYALRADPPDLTFRRHGSVTLWRSAQAARWGKITCNEGEDVLEFVVL